MVEPDSQARVAGILEERAWLRAVLDHALSGILVVDETGDYLMHNARLEDLLGVDPRRGWDHLLAPLRKPDGSPVVLEDLPIQRTLGGQIAPGVELVIDAPDGAPREILCSSALVKGADGDIVGGIVHFDDVTELRRRERRKEFLARASERLTSARGKAQILSGFMRLALPAVADGCVVTEIVGGEKLPIASDCTTPERRALLVRLLERVSGGGLTELGAVAELRKTLFIPDVDSELKRIRANQDSDLFILEALAASSFASVPLVARDETVGALSLFTFGARRLDPADLAIIESLGRILALALKNDTHLTAAEAASVHAKLVAERLQAALESMDDAVAIFDLHDTLVLCNEPYRCLEASFAATQIEESSQSLLDTLARFAEFDSAAEAEKFASDRRAAAAAARDVFDVRVQDGRSLRVMNRQTQAGRVVTVWDLTDDARRETELREARLAAEAASHAKSEFLSSMSHELRTPLNAILGFAQLLGRDRIEPLSTRHKSRVDQILKGGEHLLRLIDDILDLVRIEAGGISISPEPLDVVEVLSEVLASLEPQATRAGVKLELGDVEEEHVEIRADRTRYSQILLNFGSNAIKYNKRGGRATFHVRSSAPGRVRVSVVDDGVGIPYDRQASLFQPFQRAGQETGPIEGTGIGLVITRRLARLMEGNVGFTSTPGEGSEFWIDMPLWEAEGERSVVTQKLERPQSTFPPGVSRLVLYIEDNPANVDFMVDVFETLEGFELVTARTAGEGIDVAEARHPAAVLMDINLPDMSGFEAKEILSSLPGMQRVPVIALSAAATERDRQRGSHAGFFRYLTKPVEIGELESALSAALAS